MEEIWIDIKGYEGLYQVSNLGRVRSLTRIIYDEKNDRKYLLNGKILNQFDNGRGYMTVHLRKKNRRCVKYVHRLVAEAFLNNYNENKTINHRDFNTKNNNVNNLECCSLKENINYSRIHNRYKKSNLVRLEKTKIRIKNKMEKLTKEIVDLRKSGMSIQNISKKTHLKTKYVKEIIIKNKIDPIIKIKCIETQELFDTINEANLKYGVTTIKDCLSGKQKTSAGLHWERVIQCQTN